MKKRIISFLLAMIMVAALFPAAGITARADDEGVNPPITEPENPTDPTDPAEPTDPEDPAEPAEPECTDHEVSLSVGKDSVITAECTKCGLSATAKASLDKDVYEYTNKAVTPAVTVKYSENWEALGLPKAEISFANNNKPGNGTAKVTVTKGASSVSVELKFRIVNAAVKEAKVEDKTDSSSNYGFAWLSKFNELKDLFTKTELKNAETAEVRLEVERKPVKYLPGSDKQYPFGENSFIGDIITVNLWKKVDNRKETLSDGDALVGLVLPKDLRAEDRVYKMIRFVYEGRKLKYEEIECGYDAKTNVLAFMMEGSGDYAIICVNNPAVRTIKVWAQNAEVKVPDKAEVGKEVTFTVTVKDGYVLDKIVVYAPNALFDVKVVDLGKGQYSFVMPRSNVEIQVYTKKAPALPFIDVLSTNVNYDDIKYVYENGLMFGVTDNIFGGNNPITRGMIVAILWRLEGSPTVVKNSSFKDVAEDDYYGKAVVWAEANGIVYGYKDGTFKPNDNIDRQQLACILYRYAQYKGLSTDAVWMYLIPYTDGATVQYWAETSVKWCIANNLMTGRTATAFAPEETATRTETAAALHQLAKLMK